MSKFIIQGGKRLEGEVKISGSKNAALPIIAATVLNGGKTTLYNIPDIQDVQTMFEIIKDIGGNVTKKKNKVIIDTSKIHTYEIPDHLMRKMRSSVILAGALIGKYHKARFSCPGGCDIGARPIDLHLKGFEKLGINIKDARQEVEHILGCDKSYKFGEVTFSDRAKKILEIAWEKAKKHNNTKIASENLLWAITKSPNSIAMQVLANLGVDVLEIKQGILQELANLNNIE